jgi:midasin (ATPase involved in ribosome maturation)
MDIKTFVETASRLPANISLMVRGPHGIGKSQIFKQVADNLGLELVDRRLSQMTEGDLIGLPELTDGVTRFCPPDWFMDCCKNPRALLLDEYNRATPEVLQTAMQITLDRELNGHKLHPGTRIFAAVNASAEYSVNELDPAQADRFWTIDLEPTVEDWLNWAKGALVDDVIIDFIRQQPKHLRHNGQMEPGKVYPSQRSWDRLDRSLKHAKLAPSQIAGTDQKGLYFISVGFVGFEAASALADFVKNYESQISAEDVVDGWKKNKDKILKLSADKQNAVLEKVLDYCGKVTLTDKQSDNIAAMLKELSGEMMVSFVNKLMALNRVDNLRAIHSRVRDTLMLQVTSAAKKK